jgi:hypothetical protein
VSHPQQFPFFTGCEEIHTNKERLTLKAPFLVDAPALFRHPKTGFSLRQPVKKDALLSIFIFRIRFH